ncbi:hypothetical protein TCAL_14143 [Tigriopus californicus]|uniref:Ras-associating domain-containing protein n=1 Tax=Tigriopus californicus TaxID=6832 RepID=A0A553P8P6_TIGCA|nr:ras association domain-containing protein 10-like [Tigriopus californicus]XP_059080120.1 ras association domain-containing protein 10-like [Tigriopus californicus]TRY74052.1 hypothetical protein TCAL_14143 [Tigriopus californicus]|eukprot:TCALIF_14143-PA protein Name:"Similar to rassf10 Ras association domain-containing protein 10 (Xenopus laevis)" AED:0.16 eAED:0.19 QI:0/-1/0/1/-1/1/1/0/645
MAEIPFWFHDRPKWVSGITKYTTCQDVLHSLVRSHVVKSRKKLAEAEIKATSQQLVLVEQWRGVERPLSNSSRVLKLWSAWGEERSQVRFVVKRITSNSTASPPTGPTTTGTSSAADPGESATTTAHVSNTSSLPRTTVSRAVKAAVATGNPSSSTSHTSGHQHHHAPQSHHRTDSRSSRTSNTLKTRRRNSRLAGGRSSSMNSIDTVHPSALTSRNASSRSLSKTSEIERLMRIILTQGETIHTQLKKLQEREGQIDSIEQKVHDSRTKTAGKNYLLNAYLENLSDGENPVSNGVKPSPLSKSKSLSQPQLGGKSESVPECVEEMVEALHKVHALNEQLEQAEERLSDLHCQISVDSQDSSKSPPFKSSDLDTTSKEVTRLRSLNDKVGQEIDYNRQLISSMRSAFEDRKALMFQLEKSVTSIEDEGHLLEDQLQRLNAFECQSLFHDMEEPIPVTASPTQDSGTLDDDDLDEELINDILNPGRQYQLSNSQLYDQVSSCSRKDFQAFKDSLHIKTGALEHLLGIPPTICSDSSRINATGSPGSSTSGNSSGSGSASSEKSVRFSERDHIMSTPDLPPIPQGDFPFSKYNDRNRQNSSSSVSQYTKSILKSADASGDLDSNSDTGLSSLHSSSDEGTYVLDTLV